MDERAVVGGQRVVEALEPVQVVPEAKPWCGTVGAVMPTRELSLEHVLEDLDSTVDIRLLEASILLLAEVTVFATAAVAVAVYTAFIPAPATPTNTDGSVKACRAFVRNKLDSDDRSIC